MQMFTRFFTNLNYIYVIEILVFLGIVAVTAYVFYCLGLIKKPE